MNPSTLSSILVVLVMIIMGTFSVVTLLPQQAAAWPPQGLQVGGHVYDVSGNPVTDARVLITIEETGHTREDMTDSAGYYRTDPEFNDTDWDLDYTIHVESWSTSLGYQDNSTTVDQDIYDFGIAEIDVSYAPATLEFDLAIVAGWNFMTVPLVDQGYKASTLNLTNLSIVASWNPATGKYDKTFIVGASPSQLDFTINPSTGYWVYTSVNQTLHLLGTIPTDPQSRTINVLGGIGWVNMAFNTLNTTWKASMIPKMYTTPANVTLVAWYNTTAKSYKTYIYNVPPTDYTLTPGQAYWCLCTMNGTFTYTP